MLLFIKKIFQVYSLIFLGLFYYSLNSARADSLINKIAVVIDDQTFALSELKTIQNSFDIRSEISPVLYTKNKSSLQDIANILIKKSIIKQKLQEIGYNITDQIVEERIQYIEKAQGLTRAELTQFLDKKNINFSTYFELIRESVESTQYMQKNIYPTIEISDAEIKNFYLKNYPANSYKSIKYSIIMIKLPVNWNKLYSSAEIITHLKSFRQGQSLPDALSSVETEKLENIDESGLAPELIQVLSQTEIGEYSAIIQVNNRPTLFFVENKNFSFSGTYQKEIENIKAQLMYERAQTVLNDWINLESRNHYINIMI